MASLRFSLRLTFVLLYAILETSFKIPHPTPATTPHEPINKV